MIDTQEQIEKLQKEGFTDVRVCPMPPNADAPEHTHDVHTVHVILHGELTISDAQGTRIYRPGDRVEFPAGTTHKARSNIDNGTMIIGVKTKQSPETLHQCPECGLHYREKEWATKCEAWCKEHGTCNVEFIAHAEEGKSSK